MLIRLLLSLVSTALMLGFAGCADHAGPRASGASSPEAAVDQFLAPFAEEPPKAQGSTASEELQKFWASTCDHIDPRIRPGIRFYEEDSIDPQVNCGAAIVLLVLYTGDTGQMLQPSKISGTPVSAKTSAGESIVTVDMRYESQGPVGADSTPAPPPKATIKVLVVKRDGSWWVATPQAFNPLSAVEGGLNESQLRHQYKKLLAARYDSSGG